MARYNVPSNTIFLGQGFVPSANYQPWGLIIHECVHAGMDLWKVKVTNADSEAMAYVAQMRYLQLRGVPKETAILAVGDAPLGEIYKVAWNIATQLQKNDRSAARRLRRNQRGGFPGPPGHGVSSEPGRKRSRVRTGAAFPTPEAAAGWE
jgi:hypothetical protein